MPASPPLISLFAVPAPQARLETDARQEWTYCVYRTDAATALGGAALALLLVGQAVSAIASRCFCCGSAALRPGGARACALVLFLSSWYHRFFPRRSQSSPVLRPPPNSSPCSARHLDFPRDADARAPTRWWHLGPYCVLGFFSRES